MGSRGFSRITAVIIFALALMACGATFAQIPDKFTNLQVLDSNITKQELMGKMKEFSTSLGVRCQFCHKGNPAEGFKSFDFASDEKEHKKTARAMMRMVSDINRSHLALLGHGGDGAPSASCYTCHHGYKEPVVLGDEIEKALAAGGLDSAKARYHELKDEFYGKSVYDFSERTLTLTAGSLAESGQVEEAIGILKLNEEQFPESLEIGESFAMIYMRAGQIPEAIEACKKVLELDPDNRRMRGMLERLQGK